MVRGATADNTIVAEADDARIDAASGDEESSGVAWALPLLALGLGLVACCLLLPAADGNRQLANERARLAAEAEALEMQVALNAEFIDRLHSDPELARRLVYRQKRPDPGEGVVLLGDGRDDPQQRFALSPFALLAADPVIAPRPSQPGGGALASLCRHPRTKLAILGVGLMCCLLGLLTGGSKRGSKS